ncbi:unnamed protein product, partial [Prorocentrum cordatum]
MAGAGAGARPPPGAPVQPAAAEPVAPPAPAPALGHPGALASPATLAAAPAHSYTGPLASTLPSAAASPAHGPAPPQAHGHGSGGASAPEARGRGPAPGTAGAPPRGRSPGSRARSSLDDLMVRFGTAIRTTMLRERLPDSGRQEESDSEGDATPSVASTQGSAAASRAAGAAHASAHASAGAGAGSAAHVSAPPVGAAKPSPGLDTSTWTAPGSTGPLAPSVAGGAAAQRAASPLRSASPLASPLRSASPFRTASTGYGDGLPSSPEFGDQGHHLRKQLIETSKVSLETEAQHEEELVLLEQRQQCQVIQAAAEARKAQAIGEIELHARQQELLAGQAFQEKLSAIRSRFEHRRFVLQQQMNEVDREYYQERAMDTEHYLNLQALDRQYQLGKAARSRTPSPPHAAVAPPGEPLAWLPGPRMAASSRAASPYRPFEPAAPLGPVQVAAAPPYGCGFAVSPPVAVSPPRSPTGPATVQAAWAATPPCVSFAPPQAAAPGPTFLVPAGAPRPQQAAEPLASAPPWARAPASPLVPAERPRARPFEEVVYAGSSIVPAAVQGPPGPAAHAVPQQPGGEGAPVVVPDGQGGCWYWVSDEEDEIEAQAVNYAAPLQAVEYATPLRTLDYAAPQA